MRRVLRGARADALREHESTAEERDDGEYPGDQRTARKRAVPAPTDVGPPTGLSRIVRRRRPGDRSLVTQRPIGRHQSLVSNSWRRPITMAPQTAARAAAPPPRTAVVNAASEPGPMSAPPRGATFTRTVPVSPLAQTMFTLCQPGAAVGGIRRVSMKCPALVAYMGTFRLSPSAAPARFADRTDGPHWTRNIAVPPRDTGSGVADVTAAAATAG